MCHIITTILPKNTTIITAKRHKDTPTRNIAAANRLSQPTRTAATTRTPDIA